MSNILYQMINQRIDKSLINAKMSNQELTSIWNNAANEVKKELLDEGLTDTVKEIDSIIATQNSFF